MARETVATYSIAACDHEARQWGVAVQSRFLAVGSIVPWAEPEVGAVATQAAGGDSRGQQSAALLVVERDGGYAGLSDSLVDLRVDDHDRPIDELARIYDLHQKIFGKTPREQWIAVDDELADELRERLA